MIEALESRQLLSVSLVKLTVPPPLGSTTTVKVTHTKKPVVHKAKLAVHHLSTKPKVVAKPKISTSGGETHVGNIVGNLG